LGEDRKGLEVEHKGPQSIGDKVLVEIWMQEDGSDRAWEGNRDGAVLVGKQRRTKVVDAYQAGEVPVPHTDNVRGAENGEQTDELDERVEPIAATIGR
jgi:hypothetical protein